MSSLTNLVEHLITLIENESLDISKAQLLVTDKSVQTTGGGHDDVGIGLLVGQDLDILLDGSTTVEDSSLDIREILGEASILVLDLVGQLTSVAHNQNRALAGNRLQLVKGGQDKDRGFTETGFGLAKNIHVEDGSRDANLLNCSKRSGG